MIRNPVMFVVEVVATLTTILFFRDLATGGTHLGFAFQINLWLWFTVLFANFAEAVAEGRGKAQAASLRKTKTEACRQAARIGFVEVARGSCDGVESRAISFWSRRAILSRATVTSWREWHLSTKPPSRENRRP